MKIDEVKSILVRLQGQFTIGEQLEKRGFTIRYNGKSVCNFSIGDTYYYACNDNTPFWRLKGVKEPSDKNIRYLEF